MRPRSLGALALLTLVLAHAPLAAATVEPLCVRTWCIDDNERWENAVEGLPEPYRCLVHVVLLRAHLCDTHCTYGDCNSDDGSLLLP